MAENPSVLEMLIKYELAIRDLYQIFAGMYLEHADFWRGLAADEQRHADLLSELQSIPIAVKWLQYESPLKAAAIQASIGYVDSQIPKIKKEHFDFMRALSIARDLENTLFERQFAKIKDLTPPEMKPVMITLADETRAHLNTVVEMLAAEKQKRL